MTTKNIKRLIQLGVGLSAALAIAILLLGFALPVDVTGDGSASLDREQVISGVNTTSTDTRGPTLEQLQAVAAIDLRRPLRDPPPPQVVRVPMQARLVGTINDQARPDQSLAVFRMGDGSERLLSAGMQFQDPAGLVVLNRVEDQRVVIELEGVEQTLKAAAAP